MSKIEWTKRTWNPVVGCTPVSPGCLNCYAATMARRLEAMGRPEYAPKRIAPDGSERIGHVAELLEAGTRTIRIAEVRGGRAVFTGDVRTVPERLLDPLHWRKPQMVFVNSMSDLFHEDVPIEFIEHVIAVAALCPQHTFQVLTKRPEGAAKFTTYQHTPARVTTAMFTLAKRVGLDLSKTRPELFDADGFASVPVKWPLPNVWLGTSVENQAAADERIPHLLRCPAAVRFLSCEPLLGPVDLNRNGAWGHFEGKPAYTHGHHADWMRNLHWGIVGGESGGRPCNVEWIEWIVKQFRDGGVPCFVKQLGSRPCIQEQEHGDTVTYERRGGFWPDTERGKANAWIVRVNNRKGADPAEWPEHLRVREFPAKATAAACAGAVKG